MYLGGFVLECLLKAKLLDAHPWLQAPLSVSPTTSEQRLWSLCYRSHDLVEILEHVPGLIEEGKARDSMEGRNLVRKLFTRCGEWTVHARYSPMSATLAEAREFLADVKETRQWLR
jgi:hypothetical protein